MEILDFATCRSVTKNQPNAVRNTRGMKLRAKDQSFHFMPPDGDRRFLTTIRCGAWKSVGEKSSEGKASKYRFCVNTCHCSNNTIPWANCEVMPLVFVLCTEERGSWSSRSRTESQAEQHQKSNTINGRVIIFYQSFGHYDESLSNWFVNIQNGNGYGSSPI